MSARNHDCCDGVKVQLATLYQLATNRFSEQRGCVIHLLSKIVEFLASYSPPLPPFESTSDIAAQGQRWIQWLKRFENFVIAANITDSKRKTAMLLHLAGEQVHEIYSTLQTTLQATPDHGDVKKDSSNSTPDGSNITQDATTLIRDPYDVSIHLLNSYFQPKKNVDYETYNFRQCTQQSDETLAQFCTRLRMLARTCDFHDVDREIKTQIITATCSTHLRRRTLQETSLTLTRLLEIRHTLEMSELQASGIESKEELESQKEALDVLKRTFQNRRGSRSRGHMQGPLQG